MLLAERLLQYHDIITGKILRYAFAPPRMLVMKNPCGRAQKDVVGKHLEFNWFRPHLSDEQGKRQEK